MRNESSSGLDGENLMKRFKTIVFALWLGCISMYAQCQGHDEVQGLAVHSSTISTPQDSTMRFVRVSRIFIVGNKQTKPQIILRELNVGEGDVIFLPDLQSTLIEDKNKLINTRLFNKVEIHLVEIDRFLVDLIIEVNERWYTFPIPILALSDRNFNDWIQNHDAKLNRLNYGLRFYQYNMRGRNERLRGIIQLGFTRKFELSYNIPYINRAQKSGLNIYGGYAENKSVPYRTTEHKLDFIASEEVLQERFVAGLNYTKRENFYTTHHFMVEHNFTTIDDTVAVLNEHYLLDGQTQQRYFKVGYKYDLDKRDIKAYPLKGHQLILEANKLGLGIYDDIDQWELYGAFSKFMDLGRDFYLSANLTGEIASPERQPYLDMPALGYGKDFIRGYELYVIEGQNYFINKVAFKKKILGGDINLEPLLGLDQFRTMPFAIYLKSFYDSGIVNNNLQSENSFLNNRYIYGGGIGLDIVTFYDTIIRLEYSVNKQQEGGFFFHFRTDI